MPPLRESCSGVVGGSSRLGFGVVEVLPKAAFLFDSGFVFGEREMGAEGKVSEGVAMENVVGDQRLFEGFEVNPELADAEAVVHVPTTADGPELGTSAQEVFWGEGGEGFDDVQLFQGWQLGQLPDRLVTEIHLVHRWVKQTPRRPHGNQSVGACHSERSETARFSTKSSTFSKSVACP